MTIAALAVVVTSGALIAAEATTAQTERVSVSSAGVQANGASGTGVVSADGRFVAFDSRASTLVPRDTNRTRDVFVRDRLLQRTQRVSVGGGHQANKSSSVTDISADGRYVVFSSSASNLVRKDNNGHNDVFVRDRRLSRTVRVSVTNSGVGGNSFSGLGVVSANGRFVAFESAASNLVPGDTNDSIDVFLRDRRRGTTRRVSVSNTEAQANHPRGTLGSRAPDLSASGRFVVFSSEASNLVRGDTNGLSDVFVRDRRGESTRRVSVRTSGQQFAKESHGTDFSPDGRFVVFQTGISDRATLSFSIHLRDLVARETRLASHPQGKFPYNNFRPSVSADGRFVVFASNAPLPGEDPNDTSYDGLLTDLRLGTTRHIMLTTSGTKASGFLLAPVISADGRWIVFDSSSATVVPGDTNGKADVFIHRR